MYPASDYWKYGISNNLPIYGKLSVDAADNSIEEDNAGLIGINGGHIVMKLDQPPGVCIFFCLIFSSNGGLHNSSSISQAFKRGSSGFTYKGIVSC